MGGGRTRGGSILCAVLVAAWGMAGGARVARAAEGRFNPKAPTFSTLYQAFNDSYKQALYATMQGERQRAARELAGTRIAWQMLLARYYEAPPEQFRKDGRWQADLATTTGYIEIADLQLGAGKLKEAHEALERIRWVWLELRERNGIPWFGDELTRFHEAMEPAVQSAVTEVTEANIAGFQTEVEALDNGWERVRGFDFRPASAEGRKLFDEMMANQTQAIANLVSATTARDYANIRPLALAVKRAFTALYLESG